MKLKDLTEGKTKMKKTKAPRAEHLAKVLAGRKGGAHYSEKVDFNRAKEKEKAYKDMNEADKIQGQNPREMFRNARQQVRDAMNHTNLILGKHFDRGSRYDTPDRDTIARLTRAAAMMDNINHELAAGTLDDKQDPWRE